MSRRVVPVSTLVHYLKEAMEGDPVLHGVLVEGEVSNLRIPYSGHWYFSLKDARSSISCVMFASANKRVGFTPKNGDKIILSGDVSVYEAGGSMQIIAQSMQPSGTGALYLQLEALKKKLLEEGLFQEEHKKALPEYPMEVALVTGNQTAAREDALITLQHRWPIAKIVEYPCPVQGSEAAPKIIDALKKADEGGHDVILLVRGGGSLEDLWCFNDETLARTIYQLNTPIVTGIGHEIDFTIADYAADVRANTPTGAVETAVPDQAEVLHLLDQMQSRMEQAVQNTLDQKQILLKHLQESPVLNRPERLYSEQSTTLNYLEERLMRYAQMPQIKRAELETVSHQFFACIQTQNKKAKEQIQEYQTRMVVSVKKTTAAKQEELHLKQQDLQQYMRTDLQAGSNRLQMNLKLLDAYSPLKVMDRGYSITTKNGAVLNSVKDASMNDEIQVRLKDGTLNAKVTGREN
jgi:exodeoxyribonuclease VII large subunit